jgi:hypothetical protein
MSNSQCVLKTGPLIELVNVRPGEVFQATPYTAHSDARTYWLLPLLGRAGRTKKLVAYLSSTTTIPKVYPGTVKKEGARWVMIFPGLPQTPNATSYNLVVSEDPTVVVSPATPASVAFSLMIDTPARPVRDGAITIQSPLAGSIVCPTFCATGWYANPNTISGTMSLGGSSTSGTLIIPPDSTDSWILSFTGVPEGEGYNLSVSTTDAMVATAANGNIDVSQNACTSISPPAPPPPPPPPPPGS